LQKLKRRRNTKTIAETEQRYQITETEEKTKYQNNCRDRQKYQIVEAEGQSKYQILQKRKQKLKRSRNTRFCRSRRQNITPILFFLEKLNSNTKLQKLKRRQNTKIIAET
jgi:hypothetical protein